MARTNGPIQVWSRTDTIPTGPQGGYAGGDSTAAAVGTIGAQASQAYTFVDNLQAIAVTLPSGAPATASVVGALPVKTINIGVPQGAPGADGVDGMGVAEGAILVGQAQSAQSAAASSAGSAASALTLAQQAQAASLEVPDANVSALIGNPVSDTHAAIRRRETHALVTDYGVVGDGVTDNTTAINAALADPAITELAFPDGEFLITSELVITRSHLSISLNPGTVILVPSGYSGTVWRIGGEYNVSTRDVKGRGGSIKEIGKSGGATTAPGAWTAFHLHGNVKGVMTSGFDDMMVWWPGRGILYETTGAGWVNGTTFRGTQLWYARTFIETVRNDQTVISFSGNSLTDVIGQSSNSTEHGVKTLQGRGWTFNNVSIWDIGKNPTAVSLQVMPDARSVNIVGGLLGSQNVQDGAPAGEVVFLDQEHVSPWDAQLRMVAATTLLPDTTQTSQPTMVRRTQAVAWSLAAGVRSGVVWSMTAPARAIKMTYMLRIAGLAAATGNVTLTVLATRINAGDSLLASATNQTITVPVGAEGIVTDVQIGTINVSPGDTYSVRIYRFGDTASDTYAGAVALVAAGVQYR